MMWFRFYSDAINDPKVQKLPAELFKTWVNLLCVARQHDGVLPEIEELAFILRTSAAKLALQVEVLTKDHGLFDKTESGLEPHNWAVRQHESDVSTKRVQAFRKRQAKRDETVSVTPPEQSRTETETETDAESTNADAYKGRFIPRVTETSMQELQAICPHMTRSDILKELSRCDQYYTEQGTPTKGYWFKTTSWFARINTKKTERYSTKTDPAYRGVL
jgi:hypothetical protein